VAGVRSLLERQQPKSPNFESLATHPVHTAAPISFGVTAARLTLFPLSPSSGPRSTGDNFLRDDLMGRLKAGPLTWALRA
jgi:hypothetical protein